MKLERLTQRADFVALRQGLFARSDLFSVQVSRSASPERDFVRVGFTVTKKVGNAVVRNRIKRRLREAVRAAASDCTCDLAGCELVGRDVVLIARAPAFDASFERLVSETRRTVAKALQPRAKRGDKPAVRRPAA